jgi:hypothetical protein
MKNSFAIFWAPEKTRSIAMTPFATTRHQLLSPRPWIASAFGLVLSLLPGLAQGATPPSGTVSEDNPAVAWTGPLLAPTGSPTCGGPNDPSCDNFSLQVVPPATEFGPYQVEIVLEPQGEIGDWDLVVFGPDGSPIASSGNSPGQKERVVLSNPAAGTYTVSGAPFAPAVGPDGTSHHASAELQPKAVFPPDPGGEAVTYANFVPPPPLGRPSSAEANTGVCPDNRILYLGSLDTLRLSLDECSSPPRDTWEDVSFLLTSQTTLDPILFTDRETGRSFVSQLAGKTSLMAFTDDCGDSWTPSQGAGINSGVDHQTVGGGPYNLLAVPPPPPPTVYPHAVYYCSQDVVTAQCARSDNGGLTFGPAVPMYDLTECGGLHGHIKVSPADGTVYVPNAGCDGLQAVVASEDNGLTWDVRTVPESVPGPLDPSVAVASDGTVYFGWTNGGVEPMVAVSHDRGASWTNAKDVAATAGVAINNTVFPAMVAGDPDRAALAFYGAHETSVPDGSGASDNPAWPGDWFLFVAHTYDGGVTWTTVNATPGDPIQRSSICPLGIGCENGTRNLLDFMDANIDREGRVVVAYQDGCVGDCVKSRPNSFTAVASVARQVNGSRMLAEFDSLDVPAAPLLTAAFDRCDGPPTAVVLSWSRPDDHGSPIVGYNLYRRTADTGFEILASLGDVNSYVDSTIDPNLQYSYQVTAVNGVGEGPACGEVSPVCEDEGEPESPCVFPGLTVLTDELGDHTLADPTQRDEYDIEKLAINERLDLGGGKIELVLKMVSMQNPPANSTWPVLFQTPDATDRWVRMATDALGQVSFASGTGANPSPGASAGTPADPQSGFTPDGFIRIVVDRADLGGVAPGDALTQFIVRVRTEVALGSAVTPDNMPSSLARTGSYTLVGSENCTDATPPVARDDFATTEEAQPVVIDVVANDSDGGAPPLTVTSVGQPANGQAVNNGDGTVTYIPAEGFFSPPDDAFTYTIRNDAGLSDTAMVTVTVNPACPLVPTGSFSDDFEPDAGPGWGVDTAANNLGPLSPTWQVTTDPGAQSPSHSFFSDATSLDLKDDRLVSPELVISSSSQLRFWHRFHFENTFDGGVLEISTDLGRTWEDILARDPGAFVQGGYNGTVDPGFNSPIAGRPAWTGGPLDAAAAPMEQVVVDLGAYAGAGGAPLQVRLRWRLAGDPLVLGSLPGIGWWVDDVEVTDLLEVDPSCQVNRPPVTAEDEATTERDTPVVIDVLANDSDPDGDPLSVTAVSQGANGTVTINGPGPDNDVTYTPDGGFVGADAFEYTVSDGRGGEAVGRVTVTVAEGNRDPVAQDDAATTQENTPVTIAVLANDSDPDGDAVTVSSVGDPAHGTATDNGDGTVTYSPDAGFTGVDTFPYTVSDGRGGSDGATVTVTVQQAATGKTSGSGAIPAGGGEGSFGFNAHADAGAVKGRIRYDASGISLQGTVGSLAFSGNQADFSGTCELGDGSQCTYSVHVEDHAEPGAGADRFRIRVSSLVGTVVHEADGTLSRGNIQVR